jgi:hypothetical protein
LFTACRERRCLGFAENRGFIASLGMTHKNCGIVRFFKNCTNLQVVLACGESIVRDLLRVAMPVRFLPNKKTRNLTGCAFLFLCEGF